MAVGLGAVSALGGFCFYTRWYDRSAKAGHPWAQREIYRRLPIACLASPWYVFSLICHILKCANCLKYGNLALLAWMDISDFYLSGRTSSWGILLWSWLPINIHEYAQLHHGCLLSVCSFRSCRSGVYEVIRCNLCTTGGWSDV